MARTARQMPGNPGERWAGSLKRGRRHTLHHVEPHRDVAEGKGERDGLERGRNGRERVQAAHKDTSITRTAQSTQHDAASVLTCSAEKGRADAMKGSAREAPTLTERGDAPQVDLPDDAFVT